MKIDVKPILERGFELLEKKTPEGMVEALDLYNGLLNLDRSSPVLLYYVGTVCMYKEYNALAIELFKLAIAKDPNVWDFWQNLGFCYKKDEFLFEAQGAFLKAIEVKRETKAGTTEGEAIALMNLGSTYVAQGEPETAIKLIEEALRLDPNCENAKWNGSLAILETGDYEKGWQWYASKIRTEEGGKRNYTTENTPEWDGSNGKTIILYGEQGIGDEIMFASMLPEIAKHNTVIFDAHPRLYKLFRHSFANMNAPNITVYGTRKDKEITWPFNHKIDACLPLAECGKFIRNKKEDFPGVPYLRADAALIEKYRDKLNAMSNKMKIGISWKGGTKRTNLRERIIKLRQLVPLLESVDAEWISLQYTDDAPDHIKKFEEEFGIKIHHWQDMVDDYDETAALVSNLNLVVSAPQSVVHLAGALGTPTIQMNPKQAMWQMGVYGENMPWYNCVKNIWQEKAGEWEAVIEKTKEEVCKLYQMSI